MQTPAKEPLVFRSVKVSNGETTRHTFKILQLADIHHGEAPNTEWGPLQDAKSSQLIQALVKAEKPDLVVLSGDQLTSDFIEHSNATAVYSAIIKAIQVIPDVRWCVTMGNHDDHPYETFLDDGSVILTDAKTTREDLLRYDSSLEGSYTAAGATSTYMIPIHLDAGESPAAEVYIFDTGGGSIPETIEKEQLEWFIKTSGLSSLPVPAVAFQHIASSEDWAFRDGKCIGVDKEGNVKTVKKDAGLLDAMVKCGHIHFVGVGHNHGKSYCCAHVSPLHLCYGRHSGYGGYEKVDRGARIYELQLEVGGNIRSFTWKSWVRLADGSVVDQYTPSTVKEYPSPPRQTDDPTLAPTHLPTVGETEVPSYGPTLRSPSVAETNNPSTTGTSSLEISDTPTEILTSQPSTGSFSSSDDSSSARIRASLSAIVTILMPIFVLSCIEIT